MPTSKCGDLRNAHLTFTDGNSNGVLHATGAQAVEGSPQAPCLHRTPSRPRSTGRQTANHIVVRLTCLAGLPASLPAGQLGPQPSRGSLTLMDGQVPRKQGLFKRSTPWGRGAGTLQGEQQGGARVGGPKAAGEYIRRDRWDFLGALWRVRSYLCPDVVGLQLSQCQGA